MNIIVRLKNIWKLGEINFTPEIKHQVSEIVSPPEKKMAKIIKMNDPVKKILQNDI